MWLNGLGQAKGLSLVARHGGLLSRFTGATLSVNVSLTPCIHISLLLQEYYWIEEDVSITEPTWYNVVYFEGRGDEV